MLDLVGNVALTPLTYIPKLQLFLFLQSLPGIPKPSNFKKRVRKVKNEAKVWGGGNVSASDHEDTKWYCISVEHVIIFFIIISISLLLLPQLS
jgi:hypothetical protein